MELLSLHPAAGRKWRQLRIGNVAQAQLNKHRLVDMSGFPLWELQLFRFDTHLLSDGGVNLTATLTGQRHFYLEVMTEMG